MDLFLTPEQIEILTGYQYKAKQREELRRQGIPFLKRHDGFPVVSTDHFTNRGVIVSGINEHKEEPNFEGL